MFPSTTLSKKIPKPPASRDATVYQRNVNFRKHFVNIVDGLQAYPKVVNDVEDFMLQAIEK